MDFLVCVFFEVLDIGKMLVGVDDMFLGKVICGWDIMKCIVFVFGMDMNEWFNLIIKCYFSKIYWKWNWV